ncbi:hypothetical protein JCM16358_25020 [Halanaerocella petrolearia]
MTEDGVNRITKTSPITKTNQYHDHAYKQNKGRQQKKSKKSDFLTLTEELKDDKKEKKEDNQKESYSELEEKLKVDTDKWGIETISNQILDLIKEKYQQNPTKLKSFHKQVKKIINISYKKAHKALEPLPTDSEKLITATYKETRKKLKEWTINKTESSQLAPKNLTLKTLQIEMTELFLEQGRYFKEQKTLQPTINLKG